MTSYALLLERPRMDFHVGIIATCAVVGLAEGYVGCSRDFANVGELREALDGVGVTSFEMDKAVMSVRSGFTSFIRISREHAVALGLLVEG